MDENKEAVKELRKLAETYGPGSDWAKAQQNPQAVEHAHKLAADMLREVAKGLHADAQRNEQQQKGHIDVDRYARAADAYAYYLPHFAERPRRRRGPLSARRYLFLQAQEVRGSGRPISRRRAGPSRWASCTARRCCRRSRPTKRCAAIIRRGGKKELLPTDKRMGEAIDLYATLFPQDPEIANVLYKNGQLFYDYGEYDEAVKRFGLIVEKYPKKEVAAAAGDKILESLNKAHGLRRTSRAGRGAC